MKNILKYLMPSLVVVILSCKKTITTAGTEPKTRVVCNQKDSIVTHPNAGESFTRSAGDAVTNTGGTTGAAVKARPGR